MPPKKRSNTRSAKKTAADTSSKKKAADEANTTRDQDDQQIEEPRPKRTRSKKKVVTPEASPEPSTSPIPEKRTRKSLNSSTKKPPVEKKTLKETNNLLLSPTKRLSTVSPSRIPSPLKRKSLETGAVITSQFDKKRVESSVSQSFVSKNLPKLTSIIDDLKSSKSDLIFNEYKASIETRLKTSDDLISSLSIKNESIASELEQAKQRIIELENKDPSFSQKNEEQLFESELILDMLEQIVGLRIHKADDTDDALIFECSQSGKNGSMYSMMKRIVDQGFILTPTIVLDYKLTIYKEDSSEIIYSPIANSDTETLKKFLPDYFFDDLTFPLDTLQQFYHKIYRGLNK